MAAIAAVASNPVHRAYYLGTRLDQRPLVTPARPSALGVATRLATPAEAPASAVALDVRSGWTLKEITGQAEVTLMRADGRQALRLRSERSSFLLYRGVTLDVAELPLVRWSWKVTKLPFKGDVREDGRDDQAAQLYVAFPRWPSPLRRSDVIGYVWDTTAPIGTRVASRKAPNVRVIVVESGPARVGAWLRYERDVAADYASLFGRQPPRIGQVAVMVDSDDTRTDAEMLFGGVSFARSR